MEMRPSTSQRLSAPAPRPASPLSGTPSSTKPGPRSVRSGSPAISSTASTSGGKSGGPPPTNTSSPPPKPYPLLTPSQTKRRHLDRSRSQFHRERRSGETPYLPLQLRPV